MREEIEVLLFERRTLSFESPPRPRHRCATCSDSLVAKAHDGRFYCYRNFVLPAQMELGLA